MRSHRYQGRIIRSPSAPARREQRSAYRARPHGLAEGFWLYRRVLAEATIGRFKRVIGDGLRSSTDQRQTTEINVAVAVLNRMLELGHPKSVRIA